MHSLKNYKAKRFPTTKHASN